MDRGEQKTMMSRRNVVEHMAPTRRQKKVLVQKNYGYCAMKMFNRRWRTGNHDLADPGGYKKQYNTN